MADARWAVPADVSAEKCPALPRGFLRKGEAPASRLYLPPLRSFFGAHRDFSRLEVLVRGADGVTTAVASPQETLRCLFRTPVVKMALFIFPPPLLCWWGRAGQWKKPRGEGYSISCFRGGFPYTRFWTSDAPLDVRLWLLADIQPHPELRPLYPRKRTFFSTGV